MRKALFVLGLLIVPVLAATVEIGSDELPNSKPFCGD
jgi:hypothetical protein